MQFRQRYTLFFVTVTAVFISLWLYWPTMQLPLIYDTLLHIRITGTLDWVSVWLPVKEFGFYRPLTFFPMLVIKELFGYYPSRLLHGLNVFQHAANAGLLVWLSRRLGQNGRFALAAGLLFALFPFSYQAIAVYGHNVHPTTVGLILLGLHSYLTAFQAKTKRPFWWTLTGIWFVFSLLSHESAVLFGGFAALAQWNLEKKLPRITPAALQPRKSPWLVFLALGVVYLVGYQFLPITRSPDAGNLTLNSLNLRVLYLLQAVVYPLAWLAKKLPIDNAPLIVWGGTAVIALCAFICLRHSNKRLPLLLGAGWWMAAYTLIGIPLSTSYLLHGPRLLYVGSVGVALFWATLLESLIPESPANSLVKQLAWLGGLLFILTSSGFFIRDRLQAYRQLTSPVNTIKNTMANFPQDATILALNLPEFLDPPQTSYPVGIEFVSMLGGYLFVEELMDANLKPAHPSAALVVPEQLTQTAYNFAVHDQQSWDDVDFSLPQQHVFLTTYAEDGLHTVHTGWLARETAVSPPIADFTQYKLLAATAGTCADQTEIRLTWTPTNETLLPTTTIFVQVFDASGALIGQEDGPPLSIRADLLPADPYLTITDLRQLNTNGQTPTTAIIGVYNYLNGARFAAADSREMPLPDNAWRIQITSCS